MCAQSVQKCMFHNRCVIDKNTRRFCPSCRLKKCFDIGMKADLILGKLIIRQSSHRSTICCPHLTGKGGTTSELVVKSGREIATENA